MTATNLHAILTRVAASCQIDLLKLVSQPECVDGLANPLALLPHHRTPDDVYAATLQGRTGEQALRSCLKSSMRGRLRTKERKLQERPGYRYIVAATPADVDRLLEAFLVQKAAHLAEQGLPNIFEDRKVVGFLRAACHHGLADRKPVIELHAPGVGEGERIRFDGTMDSAPDLNNRKAVLQKLVHFVRQNFL